MLKLQSSWQDCIKFFINYGGFSWKTRRFKIKFLNGLKGMHFYNKKNFDWKMNPIIPKLKDIKGVLQRQMPGLQFLKTLIFSRTVQNLQNWVNFSIFLYLKFLSFCLFINGSANLFSKLGKVKRWKRCLM